MYWNHEYTALGHARMQCDGEMTVNISGCLVLRYPKLVSLTTPQQIDTNTNRTVRASRPVHTSPFVMSFVWLSGSSVRAGALSPTGYEPSWPLSAAFCVYLCFLCVTLGHLSHLGSFQCFLCLSAPIRVSIGGELSAPIWVFSRDLSVFFWDDLHWEVSLHCISHL
jgi:hypothetical protein